MSRDGSRTLHQRRPGARSGAGGAHDLQDFRRRNALFFPFRDHVAFQLVQHAGSLADFRVGQADQVMRLGTGQERHALGMFRVVDVAAGRARLDAGRFVDDVYTQITTNESTTNKSTTNKKRNR